MSILAVLILTTTFLAVVIAWFLELTSLDRFFNFLSSIKNKSNLFAAAFKVDEQSRRHGGELVAEVLKSHGVETIYTLVGGHISPILVSCEANGIRVVDTRHEVSAVFAADATARLKQSIGVVAVTAGPGLTNTVTAIKNAQMAESPVILLGGAAATLLKGRGALQDIDQMSLFKPLCKFTATIGRLKDIVPVLKEAMRQAQSGTPGPVFVEFPIDTLYPYHIVHRELGLNPNPKSIMQRIVNYYLQMHVSRLFGDAWQSYDTKPLPVQFPSPLPDQMQLITELVGKSKRPLLLVGSQALLPPVKADHLRTAVESLGIPTFLGGMARGLLGRQGRLHIRQQRRDALKEADLVILAGTVCDFRLGYGRTLPKRAAIISVNRNKENMTKNSDMFWKPTVAVNSDVGSFIVQLSEGLKKVDYPGCDEQWLSTLRTRNDAKEMKNSEMGSKKPNEHLNPINVLERVERHLPDDAIIVADGGDFVGTAAYTLRPRGPLQWLDPGAFGTLGVGGGFALGAKISCPNRPVWIIYGDGSFGYSISEFDTYKRHKYCAYDEVSRGFGAMGETIDVANEDNLEASMKAAVQANENGQSAVLNVLIGKSSFREGSISV